MRPEPEPVKIDQITARILETLSPKRRDEISATLNNHRKYLDHGSAQVRLDGIDISHPNVTSVTIKATQKKVQTTINLRGATIRNGRQVMIQEQLPLSILASLKKRAANDIIDTSLLEGFTILYARNQDIFLKDEEWVDLHKIVSTGKDIEPITSSQFLNRLEQLNISEIDGVLLNYLDRLEKKLHIALARIEARCGNNPDSTVSNRLDDLAAWQGGERAFFSISDGKISFTIESKSGSARYSNGHLRCWSQRIGKEAERINNLCYHLPRITHSHQRQTKKPCRTIAEIRERLQKYGRF